MLNNDRKITISTAGNRWADEWPPSTLYWSEFVEKLRIPVRSTETLAEYLGYRKTKQDNLKDVGGFVAGTLAENRRKSNAVIGRDIITLDLDRIPAGETNNVLLRLGSLGCAFAVYSTRKHYAAAPRLRVLLPVSRTVTADEYEPIARMLARLIGIEMCDPTTFQASRLMYWPSTSSDSEYVFTFADKPFVDADGILGMYQNWCNVAEWPEVPGATEARKKLADKQEDPTNKNGIVGAFCRVYDIYSAINDLIPGIYTQCDGYGDRLTFTNGSTTGGAVIYDNGKFLYSHHATDPAGGKLCNAFDLVRAHKFDALDDEAKPGTPTNRLPSYTAMCEYAAGIEAVAHTLNKERYEAATAEFETPINDDENWMSLLQISKVTGLPAKTIDNIVKIIEHDPLLRGKIGFDEFSNRGVACGALPWDKHEERREWSDVDDKGLRRYLELVYNIASNVKTDDALGLAAYNNTFNDVTDYLNGLEWDGEARLDTLLIDYLGAADSIYTRTVTRKSFIAAVARAYVPGTKFDWVTILVGSQGIGKSTLLKKMGGKWYSDSLTSFDGKDAAELIQGIWINELGELASLSRSETNVAKQFISKTDDLYRVPYGKRTQRFPRRGVFFGTSNEMEFLKDLTGDRRFWPVTLEEQNPTKNIFKELDENIDQIWAEAKMRYLIGEQLFLPKEIEEMAKDQQDLYRETSYKEGIIRDFLEQPVPVDWNAKSTQERCMYWNAEFGKTTVNTEARDRVCAVEIWRECFNSDLKYFKNTDAREINSILARLPGWKRYRGRFGPYGQQKGFKVCTVLTESTENGAKTVNNNVKSVDQT